MSYSRETKVGVGSAPQRIDDNLGGGPLTNVKETPGYQYKQAASQLQPRSKMERIGFWFIVVAAIVLVLVLSGFILPPLVGGIISAGYIAAFVGALTLMNLKRPSGWANAVLGRRVFPVLTTTPDSEVWRLAGVNAALVFLFGFIYHVLASTFIGGFLAGLIVFIGFAVLGIFYNRVRRVVIKP
ncbi:MAG: hypothetical protein ABI670_20255 [Chloroflexota bacterium]